MSRIEREKRTVEVMIRLYCRHSEGNTELCDSCRELLQYACERLDRCRYGDSKGSCKHCRSHCYNPRMRELIRLVMRFSGPRMILYAPIEVIRHLIF